MGDIDFRYKKRVFSEPLVDETYNIKDWRKNVYFLKHIVACIKREKDEEVIENTLFQLKHMIIKNTK